MKYKIIPIILALSVVLCACGASQSKYSASAPAMYKSESVAEEAMYDVDATFGQNYENSETKETATIATENATTSNRKLIKTVDLSVETKEFDALVKNVNDKILSIGGYVERMDGYYGSKFNTYRSEKNATIVARVPSAKLDDFIASVGDNSNITYRSENVTDVTLDYVDLESHKKMLAEEQNRLLEFLKEAETIEDIITIEDRLTEVKYQLDSMESQIRTYDNKIDYSTVTLSIQEVIDYTVTVEPEKTVLQRMGEGFVNSITSIGAGVKEFAIWFVIKIPYFILWGVIIAIISVIVKKIKKRNPDKLMELKLKREKKKAIRKRGKDSSVEIELDEAVEENKENV